MSPAPTPDGRPPALELDGFGVLFGRKVVLASIDAALPATGIDVLMGPVKTGKSTLLRSLCGLNDGNRLFRQWGAARMFGRPIAGDWRPRLVQQHVAMLNQPVRDAVLHHLPREGGLTPTQRREHAAALLADNGLEHLVPALDAPLLSLPTHDQRAVHILATALVEPPLLFVDEPTFGLDDAPAQQLLAWLTQLGHRTRIVVALHHQGQARRLADRILLIGGGRVIAYQPTADFFTRPANELVEHFIRSGSLPIASPGALADELESGVAVDLPEPALAALREFIATPAAQEAPATPLTVAAIPVPAAASVAPATPVAAPAPATVAGQVSAPVVATRPVAAQAAKASPPLRPAAAAAAPVQLPAPLAQSVEDASTVGMVTMPEYRGPNGFHWIVRGKLAGCPEPGVTAPIDYDLDLLRGVGVTHLITLTEKNLDQDLLAEHGLANVHLPIFDRHAPSIAQTYMLLLKMQALMARGAVLAVHCKAGVGRTGTILGAWLIRDGGLTAEAAMQRLRRIQPAFVQTEEQEEFLRRFELDLMQRV